MFGSSYLLAPIRCSWTTWTSAVPGGSRDVRGSAGRQDWPHPVLSFSPEDRHGEQHPGPTGSDVPTWRWLKPGEEGKSEAETRMFPIKYIYI